MMRKAACWSRKWNPTARPGQAGVRQGMFISHVGEQRVTTPEEFHAAVRNVTSEMDLRLTQPLEPTAPRIAIECKHAE